MTENSKGQESGAKFLGFKWEGDRFFYRGRWWRYVKHIGWAALYVQSWIQTPDGRHARD